MKRLLIPITALVLLVTPTLGNSAPAIPIVAAENFYGDVAHQIGGPEVAVSTILSNPDTDPHLFEASPSTARSVAAAQIIIYNGLGYDAWMARLVQALPDGGSKAVVVATLTGRKPGDNPHIWYDPATMPALAQVLASRLGALDPAHQKLFHDNLEQFRRSMQPIADKIASLRSRCSGMPITATEPIAGYLLQAIGFRILGAPFQLAVMNGTEPGPAEIGSFEKNLRTHAVRMLIYNTQTAEPLARRMLAIAMQSGVPVVGVTETEPPGKTYQEWMLDALGAINRAVPAC